MAPPLTSTTYFLSVSIGGMLYGVFITLAIMASVLDYKHRQNRPQGQSTVSQGGGGFTFAGLSRRRRGCLGAVARLLGVWRVSFSRAMTTALIVVISVHRGNLMYRGFTMFVTLGGGQAGQDFLTDSSQSSETISNVTIALTSLIFDAAMCYRLWAFYANTGPVMVVPGLTFIGQIVTAVIISVFLTRTAEGADKPWYLITAYAALTLVTNIYCTVAISVKVWRHDRQMIEAGIGRSSLNQVLGILIESSVLYTGWNIVYICAYAIATSTNHSTDSPLQDFLIDTWIPLAGISFVLITVRVGLGRDTLVEVRSRSLHLTSRFNDQRTTLSGLGGPLTFAPVTRTVATVVTVGGDVDLEVGRHQRADSDGTLKDENAYSSTTKVEGRLVDGEASIEKRSASPLPLDS